MSAEPIRRLTLGAVIVAALGAFALGAGPGVASSAGHDVRARGALHDLSLGTTDPTDRATARVRGTTDGGSTTVTLRVKDIKGLYGRQTFGAHVHVGPCVAGDGAAAGPHLRIPAGAAVSDRTEVWLDFTASADEGRAVAEVPFTIPRGAAHSVVVHQLPTAADGTAGARLACLPVDF